MQELRQDPIVGRWVIVAPNRAERPQELGPATPKRSQGPCPFCEGQEDATTPELFAFRQPGTPIDGPGWRVRVIPNKYPALGALSDAAASSACEGVTIAHQESPWSERVASDAANGLYRTLPGVGVHEVIIESPRHLTSAAELSGEQMREVFAAYQQRLTVMRADERLAYALIFKNSGAAAGASMEHVHSQLLATPIMPVHVQEELTGAHAHQARTGECVFCRMIEQELADGRRVVQATTDFVAFCPFASRFPFETWLLPRRHACRFEESSSAEIAGLSGLTRRILGGLENALDQPAYNYMMHTAPLAGTDASYYHWHLEITPRLAVLAGFEWGAGFCVNPVPPEQAAEWLRQAV